MRCPECGNELIETDSGYACLNCKKKYNSKAIKEQTVEKTNDGLSSFVCPTCGSREFSEVDGKLKCKCCLNVYEKNSENGIPFASDLAVADSFRQTADFEHAKEIYKRIINENPDADITSAYWGLFLCDNNVIFETDGKGEIFPSFYRVRDTKVDDNENYKNAIDCSTVYHPEKTASLQDLAEKIEYARQKYFDISRKCNPFEVFICFKNDYAKSTEWARDIYNRFVKKYNVFFSEETLKDIKSTYRDYEPHIYYALYTAKVMILLCKDRKDLESQWVRNEWYRFSQINERAKLEKAIIPIFIDDFSADDLPDNLWHIQGLRTGKNLLADLEIQLSSYFKPVDYSRYAKGKLDEDEKARREKDLELEKQLREAQARMAELEKTLKGSTIPENVQKLQNALKLIWIQIESFGNFAEARRQANNIIATSPECSDAWLALAYVDFSARTEEDLIKNFRFYNNPNYKLAYQYASDEKKKKFDILKEQYELNVEKSAKELLKPDVDYIHNTLLTIKGASLMDMRSLYNRISTTLNKIDTFDDEYKKNLEDEAKELRSIQSDISRLMAEKVSDTFIEYSKDNTTDVLDYDTVINKAESFMPDEAKKYFIDNCYPTARTLVENAVSAQTEKFKDIISQSDDALRCATKLSEEIESVSDEFKKREEELSVDSDRIYIKNIKRRWGWSYLFYTFLIIACIVWNPMCQGLYFDQASIESIIFGTILPPLLWLFSFIDFAKSTKRSALLVCEICTFLVFTPIYIVDCVHMANTYGIYTKSLVLGLFLCILLIVLFICLIVFTAKTVRYSPKRRHPKKPGDLYDLEDKPSAFKYYQKKFSVKSDLLKSEYNNRLQVLFGKLMSLDHDLGGVVLKCKIDRVENDDQLKTVLDNYTEKVRETKDFFYRAITQANAVLTKIRKYGR